MSDVLIAAVVVSITLVALYVVYRYDSQTPEPDERFEETNSEDGEYDGPRLGEPVKFSVLVGPEHGANIMPIDNGGVYITPHTAYQRRNGEWVDLEIDAEPLFRSVATYVDPQAIRQQQQNIYERD
jgi:hypothetical protein